MSIQTINISSNLEFIAKQVVEGFITGLHKSPFHGFSVEFSEHRLYNRGEPTKNIDWKLFGKTDKLFVKRFEEETNLRCMLVIDNSSSMYFPTVTNNQFSKLFSLGGKQLSEQSTKVTFSVYCAAAITELLKKQRDAVGLTIFSDKIEFTCQPKSSSVHYKMMYHELEKLLQPYSSSIYKTTSTAQVLHEIAETVHKRSVVVVFSDMLGTAEEQEDVFSALQHLKHKKHEVILFDVVDKQKELEFNFDNRPYRFVDMETQEEIKVQPTQVKDTYIKLMQQQQKALKLKCHQYKIDLIEADISKGVEQVLIPYLLKRQKMH